MASVLKFSLILPLLLLAVASQVRGQTCPEDWVQFRQSCYAFVAEQVSWTSAEVVCRVLGGKMLEVESQEENDFVLGQIRNRTGVSHVWIGLQDFLREGRWVWNSNLQPATYFSWGPGEPNNLDSREAGQNCVHIIGITGHWDDGWCEKMGSQYGDVSVACERDLNSEAVG